MNDGLYEFADVYFPDRRILVAHIADFSPDKLASLAPQLPFCNMAVINASRILDEVVLLVAAAKAMLSQRNHTMKTKSVYTEVVYSLSPSTNVSESLKSLGPALSLTRLVVMALDTERSAFCEKLFETFGTFRHLPLDCLYDLCDKEHVAKAFRHDGGTELLPHCINILSTKDI